LWDLKKTPLKRVLGVVRGLLGVFLDFLGVFSKKIYKMYIKYDILLKNHIGVKNED